MICLKIDDGKGYFRDGNGEYQEIDRIQKEDILHLLDLATDKNNEFEMDAIQKDNIKNEAHKIIYEALFRKFTELVANKSRFLDESQSLYKDALLKYKNEGR